MFTKFLETYGSLASTKDIPSDDLEKIKSAIPFELLELFQEGEGSLMNGFLWIVNPNKHQELVDEAYLPFSTPTVCFARDAFGSFYLWEDNSIIYVDINSSKSEVVGTKIKVFFDLKMTDSGFLSKRTSYDKFLKAKDVLGELSADECYGYFPLIGMGGAEKAENLKKVKIKEYISIVAQSLGQIQ